jgi:hypothetical protein
VLSECLKRGAAIIMRFGIVAIDRKRPIKTYERFAVTLQRLDNKCTRKMLYSSEGRPFRTPELVSILDINTRAPQAPR